jgi:hypothetical protein
MAGRVRKLESRRRDAGQRPADGVAPAEAASQRRAPPPVGIRTGRRRPRLGCARREHPRSSAGRDPASRQPQTGVDEDGTPTPFSERGWIATIGPCPNRRPKQTTRCRHARPPRATRARPSATSVRSSSRPPTGLPATAWTTAARRPSRRAIRRAGGAGTEPAVFLPRERSFGYDGSHARLTLTGLRASLSRWALSVFMSPRSRGASRNAMGQAPHRDRVASLP